MVIIDIESHGNTTKSCLQHATPIGGHSKTILIATNRGTVQF